MARLRVIGVINAVDGRRGAQWPCDRSSSTRRSASAVGRSGRRSGDRPGRSSRGTGWSSPARPASSDRRWLGPCRLGAPRSSHWSSRARTTATSRASTPSGRWRTSATSPPSSAACAGARFVFHLAAIYRFWARDPRIFYDGQRRRDAQRARRGPGRRRASGWCSPPPSGSSGWAATRAGESADETCYADIAHLYGSYKRSKYAAEHEVLRACAEGLDLSIVLPTFPLGPG